MLKFEYVRVVFQRAKQIGMLKAVAFAIILFVILGQVATKFNLVRAVGLYPAQGVVGQLSHSTTPVYSPNLAESTFGADNNDVGPNNLGFNAPSDTAIDGINHRMFVVDGENSRVLVYNLNSDNEIVDYEADYVLGQIDFQSNSPSTTQIGLSSPVAVEFDENTEYLYVSDTTNSRIMVFDVSSVSNGQPAINVLGQVDFVTASPQTNEVGLRYPMGIELDTSSSILFVADWKNNRVATFDVSSITDGEQLVNILGQTDVSGSTPDSDIDSFHEPFDVAYSANRLFVSDSLNNRVMVFDVETLDAGEPAINVLGQPDFNTTSSGNASSGLDTPEALEISNDTLFVGDSGNNRVMVFDVGSITDGEPAVKVLGQADFDTLDFEWPGHSNQIFGSYFIDRGLFTGIYFNNNYLYVPDVFAHRVMVFNVSSITDGEQAVNILGFYSEGTEDVFGGITYSQVDPHSGGASINQYGFSEMVSVEIDTVNHRLFVSSANNIERILVFELNSDNEIIDYEADYVLGQSDFVSSGGHTTASGFLGPHDMAFDSGTNYLYVSDNGSDRVLVFDVSSISDNESAIHVLGQPDFDISNNSNAVDQSTLDDPTGLSLDAENNLLYVADRGNNRVMVFDVSSITDGEPAMNVLGQPDFLTESGATTALKMNFPSALAVDSLNEKLYVVDYQNFRVLVFDVATIADGEPAVNVLGSDTFVDVSSGTTNSSFDFSAGFFELPDIGINTNNQKLFVADSGNNRIMVFDVSSIVDGEDAIGVIGQDDFGSASTGATQTSFNVPKGISLDADTNRIFVTDSGNNRVLEFGFVEITTSSLTGGTEGSSYSQTITSSGAQGVVSYEIYSGSLPTGLSLSGDEIIGTPTTSGIYNFSLVARDDIDSIGSFYSNPVDFSVAILGTTGGGGGGHDNTLPLVEIETPTQSQIFFETQAIDVLVQAADADGQISGVDLFVDGILFGDDAQIPYEFELSNLTLGNHTIFAIAYDDEGDGSESATVTFTIKSAVPIGGGGLGPSVKKACSDGVDNDQDGAIDFPNDLDCSSLSDNSEKESVAQIFACSDGIDNDEDGFTDMGDNGCSSESDNNEFNQIINPDPEDGTTDPCEANPSVCEQILIGEIDKPKVLTNISLCPPGLFNAATCITKESLDYTREVLGISVEQAWEVIDSPYGNSLTKTISVVSLVFGAVFTVLPVLFINPLSFSEILLIPVRLWSLLMSALGLKKKVRKWGVVYDSVTKRPLDPVYVSLQDSEGKEVASSITDLDGRYGFLVEPGQYRIIPKKTNYSFPSLKMVGKTRDEIYLDLYFGYVFEITEQGGVIVKNIPMDPITFDWNEFAKKEKKLTNFYSKRDMVMNKIGDFAFSLGFIMAIIAFISAPIIYNILIFALYVGLMVFREIGFRQKKSGRVMRRGTDIPLAYAIVRVFDFNTKTEVIQKVADKVGKFFCLVQKGEYYVTIESKEENGEYKKIFQSEKIKVKDGIIDNTFEV